MIQGVPLEIVDKKKLITLIEKLFASEDTGAKFDLQVGARAQDGTRRIELEISASVWGGFAEALLAGHNIDLYGPSVKKASAPVSNATPPATTPPPKSSKPSTKI